VGTRLAPLLASALLLLCAEAAAAQTIAGGGQEVQERLEPHRGDAVTVCIDAASGVNGRKRLVVTHDGERVTLSTDDAGGASCATFQASGREVSVRLEYQRLGLLNARLAVRTHPAARLRGRVLTYRWIRG
jgi:predicted small secreted protein